MISCTDKEKQKKEEENQSKHKICNDINCKKKIPIVYWKCKCERIFCKQHRIFGGHNCTFDYKWFNNPAKAQQQIDAMKAVADKIK